MLGSLQVSFNTDLGRSRGNRHFNVNVLTSASWEWQLMEILLLLPSSKADISLQPRYFNKKLIRQPSPNTAATGPFNGSLCM